LHGDYLTRAALARAEGVSRAAVTKGLRKLDDVVSLEMSDDYSEISR